MTTSLTPTSFGLLRGDRSVADVALSADGISVQASFTGQPKDIRHYATLLNEAATNFDLTNTPSRTPVDPPAAQDEGQAVQVGKGSDERPAGSAGQASTGQSEQLRHGGRHTGGVATARDRVPTPDADLPAVSSAWG